MPHTIDLKNTVAEARNTYLYAADGRKLKTTHQWNSNPSASAVAGSAVTASALNQTSTTDYVQNKVYENGTLSRVLIDGGYIEGTTYHFYITDHLGSTRTVANSSGTVIQQNKYYPFGAHFADNLQTEQEKQPYKYNGKELDNKRGLNLYDYHARQYDPAIGRFLTMDPLAEKYYSWSPYAYCLNNPINRIDPDGKREWPVNPVYNGFTRWSLNNYNEPRGNRFHQGTDINFGSGSDDLGAPVYATHEGSVSRLATIDNDNDSGGNRVQITYNAGDGSTTVSTYYMHLDEITDGLAVGDWVTEGQQIGTIGGSGRGNRFEHAVHLHYELRVDGSLVDPHRDNDNLRDPQLLITPPPLVNAPEPLPAVTIEANRPPNRPMPQLPVREIERIRGLETN